MSSDLCIRLTWNLTGSCGQQQRHREWSRMVVKQFQDNGRPPFWKSIYRHISVKNHPIFMKFWTQQQILNWMNVTLRLFQMKKLHWTDSEFDRTYFLFSIFTFTAYYWTALVGRWSRVECSQNVVDSLSCRRQSFRRVSWKTSDDGIRNANKSPKIPDYSAKVREVEKWPGIRIGDRITPTVNQFSY